MEQKDLFQSTLRRGLAGTSAVAFPLPEYGATSVEKTPDGRVISEDEYWEGRVFYRAERYTFRFPEPPDSGFPEADYVVTRVNSARGGLWSLYDHPRLVLDVLALERLPYPWVDHEYLQRLEGSDDSWSRQSWHRAQAVSSEAMRGFLTSFGPLSPSFFVPDDRPMSEAMIDEVSQFHPDQQMRNLAFKFSAPVAQLHRLADVVHDDPRQGMASCLGQLEHTSRRTLYRALVLQLLEIAVSGDPLSPCEGCGRWFSYTEDDTQARHRKGWKRRDARYHSRSCLKAASERHRRARLRETAARSLERRDGRVDQAPTRSLSPKPRRGLSRRRTHS